MCDCYLVLLHEEPWKIRPRVMCWEGKAASRVKGWVLKPRVSTCGYRFLRIKQKLLDTHLKISSVRSSGKSYCLVTKQDKGEFPKDLTSKGGYWKDLCILCLTVFIKSTTLSASSAHCSKHDFTFYCLICMSRNRLWLHTQFCSLLQLLHTGLY